MNRDRRAFLTAGASALALLGAARGARAENLTIDVVIKGRKVVGDDVARVTEGDAVTLRWSTDEAVSVHLHGYDLELSIAPDAPAEMTLEAFATGRFPVTSHGFGGHGHDDEEVVLLYLEVHPR
jgi:hypothetical protein